MKNLYESYNKAFLIFVIGIFLSILTGNAATEEGIRKERERKVNPHSISEVLDRSLIFSQVEWKPLLDIPNNSNGFKKGEKITGLPYSSVSELQKFIGIDVSLYTFLTAVNNPYSLLYRENVKAGKRSYLGGKYRRGNCATFYGTVCSSFVTYCFDECHNFTTSNFNDGRIPDFIAIDNWMNIRPGDILLEKGHISLVYDIQFENDTIKLIEISESSGTRIKKRRLTQPQFIDRLKVSEKLGYEPKFYRWGIDNSEKFIKDNRGFYWGYDNKLCGVLEPQEICTWFGDRVSIADWDKLVLNFNQNYGKYNRLIILKEDDLVKEIELEEGQCEYEFDSLTPGLYRAFLTNGIDVSNFTEFEIIDTSHEIINKDDSTILFLNNINGKPQFVYWVSPDGSQLSFPQKIKEEDIIYGKVEIVNQPSKSAELRIIYLGQFGRVISKPDHLIVRKR